MFRVFVWLLKRTRCLCLHSYVCVYQKGNGESWEKKKQQLSVSPVREKEGKQTEWERERERERAVFIELYSCLIGNYRKKCVDSLPTPYSTPGMLVMYCLTHESAVKLCMRGTVHSGTIWLLCPESNLPSVSMQDSSIFSQSGAVSCKQDTYTVYI